MSPSVQALLREPASELRQDLRWEYERYARLVLLWEHAIYYSDPTLLDAPHILRLVREIRSNRGLLFAVTCTRSDEL